MNLLAHAFLAAPFPEDIQLGNFSADWVGGRRTAEAYPAGFRQGIQLHLHIDDFTDHHPVVQNTKARLREAGFGKYAPVIADVLYDHFLARDFGRWSPQEPLAAFTQRFYALLTRRRAELPVGVQRFLPHMVENDWLTNYAQPWGLDRAMAGLSRRASVGSGIERAGEEVRRHDAAYAADFAAFFPELREEVSGRVWE